MKSTFLPRFTKTVLLLSLMSLPASAHPGHDSTAGFSAGFFHPLLGLDHLLAMIAVGLWAYQLGSQARWIVPCSFIGVMALGQFLGASGQALPLMEQGIALSVLLMGLLVARAWRLPITLAASLVGLFALFHGWAHGAEMPESGSSLRYGMGMILGTGLLHVFGFAAAMFLNRIHAHRLTRITGWAMVGAGIFFLV